MIGAQLRIDTSSASYLRACASAEADRLFLRELVAARQLSGLGQRDVAEKLGIPVEDVAAFEEYDSDPRLSEIRRYAHAIGATIKHRLVTPTGAEASIPINPEDLR